MTTSYQIIIFQKHLKPGLVVDFKSQFCFAFICFLDKRRLLFFLFCQTVILNYKHFPLPFHPSNIPTYSLLALSNSWPLLLLIATMCIHMYAYIHTYISLNTTCSAYIALLTCMFSQLVIWFWESISMLSWRRLSLSISGHL